MLKIKPKESKSGVSMDVHHYDGETEYNIKEIFVGHRTIFSIIGFTVGGILIGHSLWEFLNGHVGILGALFVGLLLFTLSGVTLHKFRK